MTVSRQPPLPMTVIGGYLGAGKTTLINQILRAPQGKRLMVMVNDFGAINIDAQLLQSADEDTLTLTNGCVCCTMGADLFMAIGDVLDRSPRPDHLIIEASGIADPHKIASAALTEPELSYGGIVTLVDAENFASLQDDPQIAAQIEGQISCADLLLISKTEAIPTTLLDRLSTLTQAPILLSRDTAILADLILHDLQPDKSNPGSKRGSSPPHPTYLRWSYQGSAPMSETQIRDLLNRRPKALYRIKGFIQGEDRQGWVLHCVGRQVSLGPIPLETGTSLIAIGLADQINVQTCDNWWSGATTASPPRLPASAR